ncbi:hypothetical protein QVA66_04400 [Staphylococcus chromogenes]|nr:hypothetical protein [Staphylococcus chromogenes]
MNTSRALRGLAITTACGLVVAGCAPLGAPKDGVEHELSNEARANQARTVSERFAKKPEVLQDPDGSGLDAVNKIFEKSETAVISGPHPADQLRAASVAAVAHAPMIVLQEGNGPAVRDTLEKLKVNTVLTIGQHATFDFGSRKVVVDRGHADSLEKLTSLKFAEVRTDEPVKSLVDLNTKQPALFVQPTIAQPEPRAGQGEQEGNFPLQSQQDGGSAPIVLVSPESSLASVATAKAYGAELRYTPYGDPRVNDDTMEAVAGMANEPMLALGRQFGTSERFRERIIRGEQITQQQPGGGGLVFPGRRIVALYGHPSGPALGVMGEQPPAEAAAKAQELAKQYQPHSQEPVVPAFEIIATVASGSPGADGDYSNEADPAELIPYIDAITAAGGYAVLDLQPGRANLLDQAKRYEELLKRPNVGLALDPEWKIGPNEKPMERVGSVEAREIDEVSAWLAGLVRDNKLPQKPLVLHQFQLQMIRDRETLNLDYDELAFVLHADGHGSTGDKYGTWDVMRQGLDPRFFMAWKNFIDEDKPMFSPERTMNEVNPKPWFVSYQ